LDFPVSGALTLGGNQYGAWGFEAQSGLVSEGHSHLTYMNDGTGTLGGAPAGGRAAFLSSGTSAGTGAVTYTFGGTSDTPYPEGTYRLRYRAGARAHDATATPVVDDQALSVTLDGVELGSQVRREVADDASDPSNAELYLGVPRLAQGTFEEYTTRPFYLDGTAGAGLVLRFSSDPNVGLQESICLLDDVRLERLASWGEALTWTDDLASVGSTSVIPAASDGAVIPSGVSMTTRNRGTGKIQAQSIVVQGELLALEAPLTIETTMFDARGPDARIQVGRPDAVYREACEIMLLAPPKGIADDDQALRAMNGGAIDLHGAPRRSWSRLRESVDENDTIIAILDDVDWDRGDEIVLAASHIEVRRSAYKTQCEKRIVYSRASAAGAPPDLKLLSDLDHYHEGESVITSAEFTYPIANDTLDQRAEVALLTRNIVVTSDARVFDSHGAQSEGLAKVGGHVMLMDMDEAGPQPAGRGRFSNVEFTNLGQTRAVGRYPIHYHMQASDGFGQFVRNCSVHENFDRAITLHGTHGVVVRDNVVYRTLGHAVFLEDGSEIDNVIRGNLVLDTIRPGHDKVNELYSHAILESDHDFNSIQNFSPASFWITNPANTIVDNVAAGSPGSGFWFALPAEGPVGLSIGDPRFSGIVPNTMPLGAFGGNVAHSVRLGFDVNDGATATAVPGTLQEDMPLPDLQTNIAYRPDLNVPGSNEFGPFDAYSCGTAVYAGVSTFPLEFKSLFIADCSLALDFAAYHTIRDSIVVATTENDHLLPSSGPAVDSFDALEIYDGAFTFRDSLLVNFDVSGCGELDRSIVAHRGAAQLHPNSRFTNVKFDSVGMDPIDDMQFKWGDFSPPPGSFESVGPNRYRIEPADVTVITSTGTSTLNPCHVANTTQPRQWGRVLKLTDDSIFHASGMSPVYRTLTANHPWLRRDGMKVAPFSERLDSVYLAMDTNSSSMPCDESTNIWMTEDDFAFVKIRHWSTDPQVGILKDKMVPAMTIVREWTDTGGPSVRTLELEHHALVDSLNTRAFPVLLDPGFRYSMEWLQLSTPVCAGDPTPDFPSLNMLEFFVEDAPVFLQMPDMFESVYRFEPMPGHTYAGVALTSGSPSLHAIAWTGTMSADDAEAAVKASQDSAYAISPAGDMVVLKVQHVDEHQLVFEIDLNAL
ncbi:MAG: G8 domain-containing protein, partial [Planctomycetota bacterium]